MAKRAGVAPSTVSHVINGTKYVSDEIKERVQNAIRELDYEPNMLARLFKLRSTKQIYVLAGWLENFQDTYRGMYEVAFDAGYRLSVVFANDNRVDYYGECFQHRAEGIINLSRFFCSPREYERLTEHDVAVVNVVQGASSYEVSINYVNAVESFVKELVRRGHNRVAFLADTSRAEIEPDTRLIALRYFMKENGLGFDDSLLCVYEDNTVSLNSAEFGYLAMKDALTRNPDVDAVYCVNDYVALGAYKYLVKIGKRVPQDISICGCENSLAGECVLPSLTSMCVDKVEYGRKCMQSILAQIEGKEQPRETILYADYIARESV